MKNRPKIYRKRRLKRKNSRRSKCNDRIEWAKIALGALTAIGGLLSAYFFYQQLDLLSEEYQYYKRPRLTVTFDDEDFFRKNLKNAVEMAYNQYKDSSNQVDGVLKIEEFFELYERYRTMKFAYSDNSDIEIDNALKTFINKLSKVPLFFKLKIRNTGDYPAYDIQISESKRTVSFQGLINKYSKATNVKSKNHDNAQEKFETKIYERYLEPGQSQNMIIPVYFRDVDATTEVYLDCSYSIGARTFSSQLLVSVHFHLMNWNRLKAEESFSKDTFSKTEWFFGVTPHYLRTGE